LSSIVWPIIVIVTSLIETTQQILTKQRLELLAVRRKAKAFITSLLLQL